MPMLFRTSKYFVLLLANISILLFAFAGEGEIYKVVNSDGTIHLTDTPGKRSFSKTKFYSSGQKEKTSQEESKFLDIIDEVSSKYGIDKDFVSSVIKCESDFSPSAVSEKGAVGLMQLMPDTALRFGVGDRYDPRENIEGGAAYIDYLMRLYSGKLELVLAAYNAGETAVEKHSGIPPFAETREFVRRVLSLYNGDRGEKAFIIRNSDGTILITNSN